MSNKNYAIEFENVGKQYRLGRVGTGTIAHDLNRWWQTSIRGKEDPYLKIGETNDRSVKGNSEYVWALKDISFKIEQGDVVGIIGKNGAGKSTLLKLLSHITAPSTGRIGYNGRIASLLEVGTGFHPEMTARENIYMNGSILGMSRQEISSKLDEIVDFAGIERYLDTPTKRFSSGMTVRLGFAVAAFLEPEILVVDEVLAVGDAEFQKKAIGKMQDVSSNGGRTVLFVSHNMGSIRQLCHSGIVLKNGMVDFTGTANDAISHYLLSQTAQDLGATWKRASIHPTSAFQMLEAQLYNSKHELQTSFECDEDIILEMKFLVREQVPGIWGYLGIQKASEGTDMWVSDSNDITPGKLQTMPIGEHKVRITIPRRTIAAGDYIARIAFNSKQSNTKFYIDSPQEFIRFEVHDFSTLRGDTRQGYHSQLLDWTFID